MPKTKNTKQKKSALSKLANLSKRARLLIVIFSFILIGGIYFTYKSFAASATIIFSAEKVDKLYGKIVDNNYYPDSRNRVCKNNIINDQNKGNMKVYNIYCRGADSTLPFGYMLYHENFAVFDGNHRLCATVQGATPLMSLSIHYGYSRINRQYWYNVSTNGYQTFCTRWSNQAPTYIERIQFETGNGGQKNRAQWINVSMLTLERQ